jgi:ABC-type nitrate/sulfonate/bicarbonate transport system substrate-binding protein
MRFVVRIIQFQSIDKSADRLRIAPWAQLGAGLSARAVDAFCRLASYNYFLSQFR